MRARRALLALVLTLGVAGCAALRERFPGPDILFVATPEAVSLEMLKVAAVTPEDVVFDLGSGDGRVVIAAARDFGAHGVGIEIDPKLVNVSRDAALAAGVGSRVTFLWQDLFVTDLTSATVVTLYLRDDVNLKLRPKLLREPRRGRAWSRTTSTWPTGSPTACRACAPGSASIAGTSGSSRRAPPGRGSRAWATARQRLSH